MDEFSTEVRDGRQVFDIRPLRDERVAVESWVARSLAATYVTLPGDAMPRELLDLLPAD